ncbi:phage tail protein I [Campylobacter jejuni]|uniref:phage tail protein I n=1 Tax=unclassified Campylobacter TaxID=2593542 RepID=UPI00087592A0|nr:MULTISPECIES: phage tail protein I [Campylobacter]EAH9333991.1 phage tail protein I [Campylobacter jejuni]EAH9335679.1 phage tail protein I [Campylobacter jejuni]EAJ4373676.1 phage tail protein I [Campylobacter jejuni]EAJ5638811.1 phage tail protein I [Campylobacter jejuni]EAJ8179701.1 phage tail protein I [Campylobacter jejuni]
MNTLILNHHPLQSKAIDLSAKKRFEDLNLASITNLALNCDERLLSVLANAYDVSIDGLNEKEARKLISKALLLDRYNGTAFAIKEALYAVFPTAVVKEWFEYNGKPYFFKVKVSTTNVSFDERTLNALERLIKDFKNVRSVLEAIEIEIQSKNNSFNACIEIDGETIEVLPFQTTALENASKSAFNAFGVLVCEISKTNIDFKGVS